MVVLQRGMALLPRGRSGASAWTVRSSSTVVSSSDGRRRTAPRATPRTPPATLSSPASATAPAAEPAPEPGRRRIERRNPPAPAARGPRSGGRRVRSGGRSRPARAASAMCWDTVPNSRRAARRSAVPGRCSGVLCVRPVLTCKRYTHHATAERASSHERPGRMTTRSASREPATSPPAARSWRAASPRRAKERMAWSRKAPRSSAGVSASTCSAVGGGSRLGGPERWARAARRTTGPPLATLRPGAGRPRHSRHPHLAGDGAGRGRARGSGDPPRSIRGACPALPRPAAARLGGARSRRGREDRLGLGEPPAVVDVGLTVGGGPGGHILLVAAGGVPVMSAGATVSGSKLWLRAMVLAS